ncbi:MAG: sulfatase-like hydrolase/transferase [Armatimonadia bacterium]|nr:sulfatase-like hydrolase/transferase [Armatimonadia bacterium]
MRHYVGIWALSGAVGGAIMGIARAEAGATALATAGEFALWALVQGAFGAAVGLLLGLLLMLIARLAGEATASEERLRSAGLIMPLGALALLIRSGSVESAGTAPVPTHMVFLATVLLAIGAGSLIAARTGRRAARIGRIAGAGVLALAIVLAGTRLGAFSADDLGAKIRRAESPHHSGEAPSVILLSVDTLRPDYIGLNGGPASTPVMDAFARESFVFTRARSVAPWTRPSFASFFSGLYPSQMGVARLRGEDPEWETILPTKWRGDVETLAERLGEAGWATAAITTNPHLATWTNAGQGFDVHYDLLTHGPPLRRRLLSISPLTALMPESNLAYGSALPLQRAHVVTDATVRLLRQVQSRPLLAWAHYMDPHAPYDPPGLPARDALLASELEDIAAGRSHRTAVSRSRLIQAYAREVEYFDTWLGHVIEELKQSGLWDEAIVVLWSDHGEEFWEHGNWEHGQSLYDELLHVPMMVHMPGQTEGVTCDASVSLLDPMPTLLDLCGLPVTDELQGRSLARLLRGEDCELTEPEFFLEATHRGGTRKGLLFGHHKLIYHVFQDRFELFDIAQDPAEQHDIFGTESAPETSREQGSLRDFTEASFALTEELAGSGGAAELSPEVRQQMRDLGYIQ